MPVLGRPSVSRSWSGERAKSSPGKGPYPPSIGTHSLRTLVLRVFPCRWLALRGQCPWPCFTDTDTEAWKDEGPFLGPHSQEVDARMRFKAHKTLHLCFFHSQSQRLPQPQPLPSGAEGSACPDVLTASPSGMARHVLLQLRPPITLHYLPTSSSRQSDVYNRIYMQPDLLMALSVQASSLSTHTLSVTSPVTWLSILRDESQSYIPARTLPWHPAATRTSALGHQKVSPYSKLGPSEQTPWSQFDCSPLTSYIFSILLLLPSGYMQAWTTLTPSCYCPGLDHPHLSSLPVATHPKLHSLRSRNTCNYKDHGSPLLRTPHASPSDLE